MVGFGIELGEIEFSDGSVLPLEQDSLVLLVGPNNAGKSQALRDVFQHLQRGVRGNVVVRADFHRQGSGDDLREWLDEGSFSFERQDGVILAARTSKLVPTDRAVNLWKTNRPLDDLASMILLQLETVRRLQLADPEESFDAAREVARNPLQYLFLHPDAEARLSAAASEAFDQPLIVNRLGGSMINLLCADGTEDARDVGSPTEGLLEWLKSLPEVRSQGDGFRAFVGVMLAILSGEWPVVLIDEPEAFLHPPQARLLGRRLANEAAADTQLLVATHSHDVLQGAIEGGQGKLSIVRLTRTGDTNKAAILEPESVKELWTDPLLRHSGALDGLFYAGVIVTESDSDSRYYGSVLDEVLTKRGSAPFEWLFVQCAGKDRMAQIVATMRSMGVPARVIVDFDFLRDGSNVRAMVEAFDGEFGEIESDLSVLRSSIDSSAHGPAVQSVQRQVLDVLSAVQTSELTRDAARKISTICRTSGGWRSVKHSGTAGVPGGDPSAACLRLLAELEGLGVFVVPVGELERWEPDIGSHGPKWLSEVLRQDRHKVEGSLAWQFMERVMTSTIEVP